MDSANSVNEHRKKQLFGLVGAVCGMAVVALVGIYAAQLFAHVALPADVVAERLAFAIRWLVIPGLTLLVGIWAAARRGFFRDAIDGTRTPANHGLEINLRYNQNTVEQVILAMIAWPALALMAPNDHLYYIPAMAVLFGIGRITFWIGYYIYPMARAFGMVLTVLPTIAAYGWISWLANSAI